MITLLKPFFDIIDREFNGESWNGLSLMGTFGKLSAAEAASTDTWEGYSAWSIGIHCAKCKYMVAKDLGAPVPEWPFSKEDWFPVPPVVSEDAWAKDKLLFAALHDTCMTALRSLTESDLETVMPSWKAKYGEVVAYLCTSDTFHGAQIRSMGLPGLQDKKKN